MVKNPSNKSQNKVVYALSILLVVMLALTTFMSYAYFTSRIQSSETGLTFGVLALDASDAGMGKFSVSSNDTHTKIVPGCTLEMDGIIKLTAESNVDALVRVKPNITITLGDGSNASDAQVNKFLRLFNGAFTSYTDSVWFEPSTADGYIYYAGKLTNSTITTEQRAINSFDLSTLNFKLSETEFGNEWQGAVVTIKLSVQAIQADHLGITDIESTTEFANSQQLVDTIAGQEVWVEFASGEPVLETITDLNIQVTSLANASTVSNNASTLGGLNEDKVQNVNLLADGENTVAVGGNATTAGALVIPDYIMWDDASGTWCKDKNNTLGNSYGIDANVFKVTAIAYVATSDAGIPETANPTLNTSSGAFLMNANITSIVIGKNVTSIGDMAFGMCTGLTSITIPEGVTSIGEYAFYNCTTLMSIDIPEGVTSIGKYAFSYCSGLTSIVIPEGVTSIGKYAFNKCSKLATVYYTGTEEQFNAITVGNYNTPFTNATKVYNYTGE